MLVRGDEVEMDLGSHITVAGRTLVQKQQRVFHVDGGRVEHVLKQFSGIGELRLEFSTNLSADRVAALANTGPDCGVKIRWNTAELPAHLAHAFFDDTGNRSAPAGMKRSDDMLLRIRDQHGDTVGRLDCEKDSGNVRNHAVAGRSMLCDLAHVMGDSGMDLADLRQGPETSMFAGCADCSKERSAIALDVVVRVVRSKSEV